MELDSGNQPAIRLLLPRRNFAAAQVNPMDQTDTRTLRLGCNSDDNDDRAPHHRLTLGACGDTGASRSGTKPRGIIGGTGTKYTWSGYPSDLAAESRNYRKVRSMEPHLGKRGSDSFFKRRDKLSRVTQNPGALSVACCESERLVSWPPDCPISPSFPVDIHFPFQPNARSQQASDQRK